MGFMKTGAGEKQKVVLAEEEAVERVEVDDGEVVVERELDFEQLPKDNEDEQEEE